MSSSNAYSLSSKAGRARELALARAPSASLTTHVRFLNHACKVVRSCGSFLRRMIDLLHASQTHMLDFVPTSLGGTCLQPIGITFLPPPSYLPSVKVTTDASGSWGCSWFQLRWDHRSLSLSIELIPTVQSQTILQMICRVIFKLSTSSEILLRRLCLFLADFGGRFSLRLSICVQCMTNQRTISSQEYVKYWDS